MKRFKEDGSLDIQKINQLPFDEYMDAMGSLTQEQVKEYLSNSVINETRESIKPIEVGPTFDKGVDVDVIINKLRKLCNNERYD